MSKPSSATPLLFSTYQQLLYDFTEGAMTVIRRVAADSESEDPAPVFDFHTVVWHYAVFSRVVRRAIVVSQYLQGLPAPAEERRGRIMAALDSVLETFAANPIDADAYLAALTAEIDGDDDDDDGDFDDDFDALDELDELDELDREPELDSDVPGRPPATLVAELCRDFGMAMKPMPEAWLDQVSADLRLLCTRAVTAAIRPSASAIAPHQD